MRDELKSQGSASNNPCRIAQRFVSHAADHRVSKSCQGARSKRLCDVPHAEQPRRDSRATDQCRIFGVRLPCRKSRSGEVPAYLAASDIGCRSFRAAMRRSPGLRQRFPSTLQPACP
jgi:hypothetical protein